jgi:DNA-binding NarL/FixJ family response regulator
MSAERARDRSCRRVLVVDDHAVFAELIMLALDDLAEFQCVGVATSASDAVLLAAQKRPDIMLVDLVLGDENGLELVRQLGAANRDIVLIVVSARSDGDTLASVVAAGAHGFAPKSGAFGDTVDVLRRARAGSFYLPPSLLAQAVPALAHAEQTQLLTGRESDVLSLMGHGASPPEIARILNISLTTCRGHVRALHRKLGVSTQLGAVVEAQRIGLLRTSHGR